MNGAESNPGRRVGRPFEGRVRLQVYVLPETAQAIRDAAWAGETTFGKIIDWGFHPVSGVFALRGYENS